jgi:hypothetical protein
VCRITRRCAIAGRRQPRRAIAGRRRDRDGGDDQEPALQPVSRGVRLTALAALDVFDVVAAVFFFAGWCMVVFVFDFDFDDDAARAVPAPSPAATAIDAKTATGRL